MVNITQRPKIDEGTNNGGLGTLLGAAAGAALAPFTAGASVPAMMGLGASLGGAAGGMLSKPGSVSEMPQVQNSTQGGAMARKLLAESNPMFQMPQAPQPQDPMQRRLMGIA
jgi:hypothetical protein